MEGEATIPKLLVAHKTNKKYMFTYDDKIDKECQQFPGHLNAPNSYDVFSIYEMYLSEQEDNSVAKVADLTQKQFDQQFHEDIGSIFHEELDLAYGSFGPKLQLGFEK
jgi:hypothetical protein